MFGSLENFYGTDAIAFSATSEELPGVTRSYATLTEAMEENGRSRVYMGIHWNFDDFESHPIGYGIADYITTNHFEPVPEPSGAFVTIVGGVAVLTLRRRR